jgi:hypothetical protein
VGIYGEEVVNSRTVGGVYAVVRGEVTQTKVAGGRGERPIHCELYGGE